MHAQEAHNTLPTVIMSKKGSLDFLQSLLKFRCIFKRRCQLKSNLIRTTDIVHDTISYQLTISSCLSSCACRASNFKKIVKRNVLFSQGIPWSWHSGIGYYLTFIFGKIKPSYMLIPMIELCWKQVWTKSWKSMASVICRCYGCSSSRCMKTTAAKCQVLRDQPRKNVLTGIQTIQFEYGSNIELHSSAKKWTAALILHLLFTFMRILSYSAEYIWHMTWEDERAWNGLQR